MNLVCFSSIAVYLSIGRTWSWLHFLPLASGLFSVGFLLATVGMRRWMRSRGSKATNSWTMKSVWASMMSKLARSKSDGIDKGKTAWSAVWFSALFCGLFGIVAAKLPKYEIVEVHDLAVVKQVAPNKWMVRDPMNGDWMYTGCGDFPNERVIWAGYVARKVRYEEHGNCKSILKADLGFTWSRDKDGNVKEVR